MLYEFDEFACPLNLTKKKNPLFWDLNPQLNTMKATHTPTKCQLLAQLAQILAFGKRNHTPMQKYL